MTSISSFLGRNYSWKDNILRILFGGVLVFRFIFPFLHNPNDSRFTDMERHVMNGQNLFHPNFINAMDPKMYQVWMFLLLQYRNVHFAFFAAFFTGLLCSAMAWFWYKALREILSRKKALILSIIIGTHLSLLVIYVFFMNETLMLTVVALSVWMTLRAVRKKDYESFMIAALCWTAASFTKQIAIPLMVMGLGYALIYQLDKIRVIKSTAFIFCAFTALATWQSMEAINVVAPFGFTDIQVISRKSEKLTFGFDLIYGPFSQKKHVWWAPESYYTNQLEPLGEYRSSRSDTFTGFVDLSSGQKDWDRIIVELESKRRWGDVARDYMENAIFLFFTFSWPDSEPAHFTYLPVVNMLKTVLGGENVSRLSETEPTAWLRLNFHLRWTWFPCFMLLIFCAPFSRFSASKAWLVFAALAMTWIFLLQDNGIIEGRYRKVLEPFLIVSVFLIFESWFADKNDERIGIWSFFKDVYCRPVIRQFFVPIFNKEKDARSAQTIPKGNT